MSPARIAFIAVCVVVSALLIGLGLVIEKNGDKNAAPSGALFRRRASQRPDSHMLLPRNTSIYFTLALLAAAVVLVLALKNR